MIFNMQSGGVMPDQYLETTTITPGAQNQVIEEGTYLRGPLTIQGDADLTPAKLPKDVNLFGIQGTRQPDYGTNVWAKCTYTPAQSVVNPTFTLTLADSTSKNFILKSFSFDISSVKDWKGFLDGFANTNGKGSKFNANGFYCHNDAKTLSFTVTNIDLAAQTVTISLNSIISTYQTTGTFKYTGTKTIPLSVNGIVAYAVNDELSAYPNRAVHTDGYYYELLASAASANVMTLSDGALDTVQQDYRDQIETEVSNA